jgi:hypothetical protein
VGNGRRLRSRNARGCRDRDPSQGR